ncbi:MAG: hypothetical protein ACF8Q5_10830 [Phycisphaerales bacterium JB040]
MNARNATRAALAAAALASVAALSACGGSHHAGNETAVRLNPTPAYSALAKRRDDEYNRWANKADADFRAMRDDLARAMYLDRPSRLHFGPKF